jgi:TPR repeat protein
VQDSGSFEGASRLTFPHAKRGPYAPCAENKAIPIFGLLVLDIEANWPNNLAMMIPRSNPTHAKNNRQRSALFTLLVSFCCIAPLAKAQSVSTTENFSTVREPGRADQSLQRELELAGNYFNGSGVPRDLDLSVYWYRKAAEQGDPTAQVFLGYLYTVGLGVPQDYSEAARWDQLAASSGSSYGKTNLAVAYFRGRGVPQDTKTALALLHSAANQGDGRAMAYLGILYYDGIDVPRNADLAQRWLRKGVANHSPDAEFNLALVLLEDAKDSRKFQRSVELLRKSSAEGLTAASAKLGRLLVENPELPQRNGEAIKELTTAAEAGWWESSALLGTMARHGKQTKQDQALAYFWMRIAIDQRGKQADDALQANLVSMASALGPKDQSEMDGRVADWLRAHSRAVLYHYPAGMAPPLYPIHNIYVPGNQSSEINDWSLAQSR